MEEKAQKAEELENENENLRKALENNAKHQHISKQENSQNEENAEIDEINEKALNLTEENNNDASVNFTKMPEIADEKPEIQIVKKSVVMSHKINSNSKDLNFMLEILVKKFSEFPNSYITSSILKEFGSFENLQKLIQNEPNSQVIEPLLKILSQQIGSRAQSEVEEYAVEKLSDFKEKTQQNPQHIHQKSVSEALETQKRKSMNYAESEPQLWNKSCKQSQPSGNWRDYAINNSSNRNRSRQKPTLKQVFNPYTRKSTGFFDPQIQYGGKSM